MTTDRICVGAISGSFGVQGEVRLKSFCTDPEAIASYGPLAAEGRWVLALKHWIDKRWIAQYARIAQMA